MGQILGQFKLGRENKLLWISFSHLFFVYLLWPIYDLSEYGHMSVFVLRIHVISLFL